MKILELRASNVKRLSVVQITPEGNLVQITGANGQGKTSVLDSILWALAGGKAIQAQPIRKGQKKARITLQLGDGRSVKLTVERRFSEGGNAAGVLSVTTPDGAVFKSPQKMLDDMLGALSFDPLAFMREDPAEQCETLRALVPLDVDLDALEAKRAEAYAARTDVNRLAKSYAAQAAAVFLSEVVPDELVDTKPLLARLTAASEANRAADNFDAERMRIKHLLDEKRSRVENLRNAVRQAEAELETLEGVAKEWRERLPPERVDSEAVAREINEAERLNRLVETKRRKDSLEKLRDTNATAAGELTREIDEIERTKADAFARAKMPVEGLAFAVDEAGRGVVTFKGFPLDQASSAEQLMVSTAIAAALSPKLRVMRIQHGNDLDGSSMKWLAAFAEERDLQVWIERVESSGGVGVEIVDGHVAGVEPPADEVEP